MSNHLKAGELYAFATRDGACIVGKLLQVDGNQIDLYVFDRTFRPLTPKSDVIEALAQHENSHDYRICITRRHFALMYPLWLGEAEVRDRDFLANRQTSITIAGHPVRFNRTAAYWEFAWLLAVTWLLMFIAMSNTPPDADKMIGQLQALCQSVPPVLFSACVATLVTMPLWILMAFRWLEASRTGLSIKKNPTLEISLPMPIDQAFTLCRDKLGERTNREFDFVDRRSGYIQGRINHNLVRIMCYTIAGEKTGIIVSCFDLETCGVLGSDFWTLKRLVASITGEQADAGRAYAGPIIETLCARLQSHKLMKLVFLAFTATFACFSAMFLKVAMCGEHQIWPLLTLTFCATVCGFYLFSQGSQTPRQNS